MNAIAQALLAGPLRMAAWAMQKYFQYVMGDCHKRRETAEKRKVKWKYRVTILDSNNLLLT